MKNFNESKKHVEDFDFKIFNEKELSMVLGGGGEEQMLDFLDIDCITDEDDDVY